MLIIKSASLLQKIIQSQKALNRSIGFTPTMGALHQGHLSLIEQSKTKADLSICSIFVNPTQFNEAADLEKYPRNTEKDAQLLSSVACDLIFLPEVAEVYPKGTDQTPDIELGLLDKVMEGAHRPGHFEGVVQVVSRLLDLVTPDYLFMGQKDFQQFTIIQHMIAQQKRDVQLLMGTTIREADGLAMSSRNLRLSPEERAIAPAIYEQLQKAKRDLFHQPIPEIESAALAALSSKGFKPEYFSIVESKTLQRITKPEQVQHIVACTAAWLGSVRLIDNLILK